VDWWGWVIVALVVLAVLVVALLAVQARRRRGGVFVESNASRGRRSGGRR
jgi:hypothetical protein